MKVLYANTNSLLSSLFENRVKPITGRFADSSLNFAQEVSKTVWTILSVLNFLLHPILQMIIIFGFPALVIDSSLQISPEELN